MSSKKVELAPDEAAAIVAWIDICEDYRGQVLFRGGSDGSAEVKKFTEEHPAIDTAMSKLKGEV